MEKPSTVIFKKISLFSILSLFVHKNPLLEGIFIPFTECKMLLEALAIWNSVVSCFQCEIKGYQNSPKCDFYVV